MSFEINFSKENDKKKVYKKSFKKFPLEMIESL